MVWRVFQYESLNDIVRAAGTYVHYKGYSQIDYSKLIANLEQTMAKRKDLDLFVYIEF
jgi:hypothetical protein